MDEPLQWEFTAATADDPGELTAHLADGRRVGYASYMENPPWTPILLYVEVEDGFRRRGIASELVDRLKDELQVERLEPSPLVENGPLFWASYLERRAQPPPRLSPLDEAAPWAGKAEPAAVDIDPAS